jgi:hypothetical protein
LSANKGPLQAVPASATAIMTGLVLVHSLFVFNPTAGDITFTFTDTAGVAMYNAKTITAGGSLVLEVEKGVPMTGVKWSASGVGLTGAYQIEAV